MGPTPPYYRRRSIGLWRPFLAILIVSAASLMKRAERARRRCLGDLGRAPLSPTRASFVLRGERGTTANTRDSLAAPLTATQ
jgi:hypothetical protein